MRGLADRFCKSSYTRIALAVQHTKRGIIVAGLAAGAILITFQGASGQPRSLSGLFSFIPNGFFYPNSNGASQTYSANGGGIDLTGPFFQSLGTNGRSCGTCHAPSDGMSVSAANVELRFFLTQGTDPIFRPVDGSNCDHGIDVSTWEGKYKAYSLLRTRGLIRIALAVPGNADYAVTSVQNPYGCNETDTISTYRRPLPATNVRFLSAVMFDGRESSLATGTTKILYGNYPNSLVTDLTHQALDATNEHAEASPPLAISDPRLASIVNFEMGLSTAQALSNSAGLLNAHGANGGPNALVNQPFFISINSSVHALLPQFEQPGGLVTPGDGQFTAAIFNTFDGWANFPAADPRAAIARGQAIFNSKQFNITGVAGINDDVSAGGLVPGGIPSLTGTCGTCHDTPNVGDHSFPTPLNIGTGDPGVSNASVNLGGLDISYLPSITLCKLDPSTGLPTKTCKTTTDPGLALIDGQFDHIGKIKGPILRGLSARAPYFHNGSARTLLDVVRFYEMRFGLSLTPQEESDLVAYLSAL
jgi:cytochrome c peroxidase